MSSVSVLHGGTNIDELLLGSEELLDDREIELLATDELEFDNVSLEEDSSDELLSPTDESISDDDSAEDSTAEDFDSEESSGYGSGPELPPPSHATRNRAQQIVKRNSRIPALDYDFIDTLVPLRGTAV